MGSKERKARRKRRQKTRREARDEITRVRKAQTAGKTQAQRKANRQERREAREAKRRAKTKTRRETVDEAQKAFQKERVRLAKTDNKAAIRKRQAEREVREEAREKRRDVRRETAEDRREVRNETAWTSKQGQIKRADQREEGAEKRAAAREELGETIDATTIGGIDPDDNIVKDASDYLSGEDVRRAKDRELARLQAEKDALKIREDAFDIEIDIAEEEKRLIKEEYDAAVEIEKQQDLAYEEQQKQLELEKEGLASQLETIARKADWDISDIQELSDKKQAVIRASTGSRGFSAAGSPLAVMLEVANKSAETVERREEEEREALEDAGRDVEDVESRIAEAQVTEAAQEEKVAFDLEAILGRQTTAGLGLDAMGEQAKLFDIERDVLNLATEGVEDWWKMTGRHMGKLRKIEISDITVDWMKKWIG